MLSSWSPEIELEATNTSVLTLNVPSALLYVVTPTQPACGAVYFEFAAFATPCSVTSTPNTLE